MNKKEKLIEYINKPIVTDVKNKIGCSVNWHIPYCVIKENFFIDEIQSMNNKEIDNLVKLLADEFGMASYQTNKIEDL